MSRVCFFACFSFAALSSACTQTNIALLTQAPPGREATLDVESRTLTLTRGVAVVLECTEVTESYSGPCSDLDVDFSGDDDAVSSFAAHLDAFPGQVTSDYSSGERVTGPSDRAGLVLAAEAEGDVDVTFASQGPPITLSVVVIAPPNDEEEAD